MSTDTFIEFVYGLPLYNQSASLAAKLADIFPDFAKDFQNKEGKIINSDKFIKELSRKVVFRDKFPGIRIQVTHENYILIVLAGSNDTLYYKYYVNCDGITLPEKDMPSKKPLKKFAKEFDLKEKPQPIIWTYEEDLDDDTTWIEKTLY